MQEPVISSTQVTRIFLNRSTGYVYFYANPNGTEIISWISKKTDILELDTKRRWVQTWVSSSGIERPVSVFRFDPSQLTSISNGTTTRPYTPLPNITPSPDGTEWETLYNTFVSDLTSIIFTSCCTPEIIINPPDISLSRVEVPFVAGENIPQYAPVTADGFVADTTNPNHFNRLIGIARESVLTGNTGMATLAGDVTNPLWSFVPGDKLFLDVGAISTTPLADTSPGFSQIIGTATYPTKICVDIKQAIFLNP